MLKTVILSLLLQSSVASPLQWQIFALRHPEEARRAIGSASLQTLEKVNNRVNFAITQKRERGDTWTLWPSAGDCDDYAVTKRHELLKLGVQSRLAIVQLRSGEYHLVLVVGDYVLDSIRKTIVRKNATGYRFIMEQTSDPNKWTKF